MKNLYFLLLVIVFLGCANPTKEIIKETKETIIYEGSQWVLAGTNQQIYPDPNKANFVVISKVPSVDIIKATEDLANGKIYGENSYTSIDSFFNGALQYIDVGTIVGVKQKLLVNVKFRVTDEADNANAPNVHIRAKGSNVKFKLVNPNLIEEDEVLVVTDNDGILEWYHENTAPYQWDILSYGWIDIVGVADYYCVGTAIVP